MNEDEEDSSEVQEEEEEYDYSLEDIGDVDSHKQQLKDLETADPKFYDYLMKKNQSLLTFDTEQSKLNKDSDIVDLVKLKSWINSATVIQIRFFSS